MKIRTDFVTNSSSSSFILGFKNEKSIVPTLLEQVPDEYIGTILRDVTKSNLTADEAIESYKEQIYWTARYEVEEQKRIELGSYIAASDWCDENKEEYDKLTNEYVDKLASELKAKMKGLKRFAEVEYCDHSHSELEHYVVPHMEACLAVISHH